MIGVRVRSKISVFPFDNPVLNTGTPFDGLASRFWRGETVSVGHVSRPALLFPGSISDIPAVFVEI